MGKLEETVFSYDEYKDRYQYKGREVNGQQIISGVYILQETLDYDPPEKLQLTLEWI